MKNHSNILTNLLRSIISVLCIMLKTNAELTTTGQVKEPRFSKQPAGFRFLSKLSREFTEINDFDTFAQESRLDRALSLVIFYSNEYCLNCDRQEEILTEVYERYKHHIK